MQKVKVIGHSVQKLNWKQSEVDALPPVLTRSVKKIKYRYCTLKAGWTTTYASCLDELFRCEVRFHFVRATSGVEFKVSRGHERCRDAGVKVRGGTRRW